MYNKCLLIGNLTRDPETKTVGSSQICKFTIAMNHGPKDKQETCFIDIVAWEKTAQIVAQYFTKGKPILVEGRLKLEQWEKDGKPFSRHVIVAEKISFIGGSDLSSVATSPARAQGERADSGQMMNESKRIFPSDRKEMVAQQYAPRNGQAEIGNNNLDASELPF